MRRRVLGPGPLHGGKERKAAARSRRHPALPLPVALALLATAPVHLSACADPATLQALARPTGDTLVTVAGAPALIDVARDASGPGPFSISIDREPDHGTATVYTPWEPLPVFNHRSALPLDPATGALLEPHPREHPSTSLTGTDRGKDDEANNSVFPAPFPDAYGMAVTLAGDHLFVSAWAETNRHSTGSVGGGAIYVYRRRGAEWVFSQKLDGGEAGDPWTRGLRTLPPLPGFHNIAADEDDLLVGVANRDDRSQDDGVFVYRLTDDSDDGVDNALWHFSEKLPRPVPEDYPQEFFGTRVVMNGGWAFVGSNHEAHRVPERANAFDLAPPLGLRFAPAGRPEAYRVTRSALAFDTIQGADLGLADDESAEVIFPVGFPFFGTTYRSLWVNSDGNISFGEGQPGAPRTAIGHVSGPPRIAPLFVDLDPASGGSVRAAVHEDRVVVTWARVPRVGAEDPNTLQTVLHQDGTIDFVYEEVNVTTGVVGIAPGRQGLGPVQGTDLSEGLPTTSQGGAVFEEFRSERVGNAGAVYVYRQDENGQWSFHQPLAQPDGITTDATFGGFGMALQADRAVITAEERKGYVYELVEAPGIGASWRWTGQTLTAADSPDRDSTELGFRRGSWRAPSMDGEWLVAGSPGPMSPPDGIGADAPTGSALFYRWNVETRRWDFVQEVVPRHAQAGARFGRTTALDEGQVVVGADLFDIDADGDGSPEIENAGTAFVLAQRGDGWQELTRLERPGPRPGDALTVSLGSISVDDPFVVVGMQVNAAFSNSGPLRGTQAGRAFVFATRPLIVYTPEPGFEGIDEFEYRLRDASGPLRVATVRVRRGDDGR